VFPVPTGTWTRPIRSNDASAAPATNGPALYVETIRSPARTPDAAYERAEPAIQFSRSSAVSGMKLGAPVVPLVE
jgi:hypothetical protein